MSSDSCGEGSKCVLYHERQRMQLCLLHALNSLMQSHAFTKDDLDGIAESLDHSYWFNKHRSMFGTGNYDVNVLIAALETRHLRVVWFDARRSTALIDRTKVLGYIFNVPSKGFIPFLNGRHWFTVREVGSLGFFNFDSKKSQPEPVEDFCRFADKLLAEGNQLMLVMKPENVNELTNCDVCSDGTVP
uniref:ubiquitinyl hydrolase 1 n=2 Tax=Ascaris TaxID=6251 RepID=A0A0M3I3T8_ASCLU